MKGASPPTASGGEPLQYIGIPLSWLRKRPKLPSRNWLIFLSASASLTGLYLYDRRKCRQVRDEYIEKVKHISEEPLSFHEFPRKVTVYGCKWPGDDDADRSLKYFRKYVKPILVAAAIDYEMVNGKRHGNLADTVAEQVKSRRRLELGLDAPAITLPIPGYGRDELLKRELEGGVIIIGRHTFKEYMHGLKRGWNEPLDQVDKEELLSQELQNDGVFDEVDVGDSEMTPAKNFPSDTPGKIPSKGQIGMPFYFPLGLGNPNKPNVSDSPCIESQLNATPSSIPPYPPFLLVPFTNLIGLSLIPRMIWDFFNQRRKVREGSEVAYRLVLGNSRPIRGAPSNGNPEEVDRHSYSDLSFDLEAENYYKASKLVSDIEQARSSYYSELPGKIRTARDLSRGEREPTKDEINFPPPTEVELRSERMNKELRWRNDLSGWAIVNPTAPIAWDPKFEHALSVYIDGEYLRNKEGPE